MDELTTVRAWDAGRPGPSEEARTAARARLEAAMARESEGAAPRAGRLSRRIVLRTAFAGLTAAAAGAVVVALDDEGDRAPRLEAVSAAEVLRRAADRSRAAGSDLPVPRDDQYFYTRTYITQVPVKGGPTRTWNDESWMSVDGSKPSLRQEHGKVHHDPPLGKHEVRWPPTVYSKLQKMPTDPDELLAMFRGNAGAPADDVMAFFEGCMLLMGPRVMPPACRPAPSRRCRSSPTSSSTTTTPTSPAARPSESRTRRRRSPSSSTAGPTTIWAAHRGEFAEEDQRRVEAGRPLLRDQDSEGHPGGRPHRAARLTGGSGTGPGAGRAAGDARPAPGPAAQDPWATASRWGRTWSRRSRLVRR
ncbi:CU044_5270 family protein [Streptomyces sp. DHE7-1]|nr:CU044_5270 family protein [Streptomyces sp. DHE7-1]